MIGHLAAKFDLKLTENDPALTMVEMCRFMMESVLESTGREWEGRFLGINEKLTLAIGAMAGAIKEWNEAGDYLAKGKLIELDNYINTVIGTTIKTQIDHGLNEAFKTEVGRITTQVGKIAGSVASMHKRSLVPVFCAGLGGALFGGVLVLSAGWYVISNGMVHVRDTSTPVAQQAASSVKQIPKAK